MVLVVCKLTGCEGKVNEGKNFYSSSIVPIVFVIREDWDNYNYFIFLFFPLSTLDNRKEPQTPPEVEKEGKELQSVSTKTERKMSDGKFRNKRSLTCMCTLLVP